MLTIGAACTCVCAWVLFHIVCSGCLFACNVSSSSSLPSFFQSLMESSWQFTVQAIPYKLRPLSAARWKEMARFVTLCLVPRASVWILHESVSLLSQLCPIPATGEDNYSPRHALASRPPDADKSTHARIHILKLKFILQTRGRF